MKLFRYRRPSIKTILGITKAKRCIKKHIKKQISIAITSALEGVDGDFKNKKL